MSEFRKLLKNTSFLAGTRMIQFVTGLFRVKLSALILGTVGVGIIDQLAFFSQQLSRFTLLGMSEALVKQIAESKSRNQEELKNAICSSLKSYIVLIFLCMLISITLLVIFSSRISSFIFGKGDYLQYFLIGVLTLPILLISTIPFSILKAFKDVKAIAKARIYIVLINICLALPMIFFFGLEGAAIYLPASYLVDLILNYAMARKHYLKAYNIRVIEVIRAPFITSYIKELFVFSSFGLTIGVYFIISEFLCRGIVVENLGIDAIGVYSPVVMFASIFTGFIMPALSTYLYPRFCEVQDNREISSVMNDAIRLCSLILVPMMFLSIPFRDLFISLVYSEDFKGASKYLPFHFVGLLFFVWGQVFSQAMTPTGRIKIFGIFRFFYISINIITTYYFVKYFGLYGWMMKFIMSPVLFFFVYWIYSAKSMDFKLSNSNLLLMIYAFLGSIVLVIIEFYFMFPNMVNWLVGPFLLCFTYVLITEKEKNVIKEKTLLVYRKITN